MWNSLERFSLNEAFFQTPSTIRTHSGKLYSIKVKGKLCWGNPLCFCGTEKKIGVARQQTAQNVQPHYSAVSPVKSDFFHSNVGKMVPKETTEFEFNKTKSSLGQRKSFFPGIFETWILCLPGKSRVRVSSSYFETHYSGRTFCSKQPLWSVLLLLESEKCVC